MIKTQPHVAVRSFLHRPKIYFQFLYHKECGLVGRYDNQRPTQKPSFLFRRPGEKQLLMAFEKRVEIRTREMMKKMQNKRKTHAIVDVCLTGKAPTLSPQPFYVSRAKRLIILSLFIFLSVLFACDSHQATPNVSQQQQARPAYLMAIEKGDYETAIKELRPLAEKGDAQAQNRYAWMHANALGVQQNFEEAAKWWLLAANQGNVEAQYKIASMHVKGIVFPKDSQKAIEWLKKSAEGGFALAQFDLAASLNEGTLIPKDYSEAFRWYKKAAEQGYATAQNSLGLMYSNGKGVQQNHDESRIWYLKAADQNYPPAQFNLGKKYDDGEGVKQDYKMAVKYYRMAALQGFTPAQMMLGGKYITGKGVASNYIEGYKWLYIAHLSGDNRAMNFMQIIHDDIPQEQIEEAIKRANSEIKTIKTFKGRQLIENK